MNVCSVLFEYIAYTVRTTLRRTLPLVFYHVYILLYININTRRMLPPPEKSVRMIISATYDSAPSNKWQAIIAALYYITRVRRRVSVANCVKCKFDGKLHRLATLRGITSSASIYAYVCVVCMIPLAFINEILRRHPFVILLCCSRIGGTRTDDVVLLLLCRSFIFYFFLNLRNIHFT